MSALGRALMVIAAGLGCGSLVTAASILTAMSLGVIPFDGPPMFLGAMFAWTGAIAVIGAFLDVLDDA